MDKPITNDELLDFCLKNAGKEVVGELGKPSQPTYYVQQIGRLTGTHMNNVKYVGDKLLVVIENSSAELSTKYITPMPSSVPFECGQHFLFLLDCKGGYNWLIKDVKLDGRLITDLIIEARNQNKINLSHYPHTCPRCKKAAYIGGNNNVDCSAKCGVK